MVWKAIAFELHESCQKVFASASNERLSSGVSFLSPGQAKHQSLLGFLGWVPGYDGWMLLGFETPQTARQSHSTGTSDRSTRPMETLPSKERRKLRLAWPENLYPAPEWRVQSIVLLSGQRVVETTKTRSQMHFSLSSWRMYLFIILNCAVHGSTLRVTRQPSHPGVEAVSQSAPSDHLDDKSGDYSSNCLPKEMLHRYSIEANLLCQ